MFRFKLAFGSLLKTKPTETNGPGSPVSKDFGVKIYPYFYKYTVVEWVVPSEWGGCLFDIYRSYTEEAGDWVKITETPTSGNYFIDRSVVEPSKFTRNFYIVECRLPSGQRCRSEPITYENKRSSWAELRAKEITRRETLLLQKFTGVDSLIYRRRHFGKRCPNCWNAKTEAVMMDKCPVCFGTSFEGGYFPGFPSRLQYEPTPNNISPGVNGISEPNSIPAWTINKPEVESWDLVFRIPDKKVYRVESIQTTELQTVPVRQILQLVELPKDVIEYTLIDGSGPIEYLDK